MLLHSPSGTLPKLPRRVALFDDDADVRLVVALTLTDDGGYQVVGEAATGLECIDTVHRTQPELVVMDLGLADTGGLSLIRDIHSLAPWAAIVVFTGRDDRHEAAAALGAASYVVKGDVSLLVDALKSVPVGTHTMATRLDLGRAGVSEAALSMERACAGWLADDVVDAAAIVAGEFVAAASLRNVHRCDLHGRLTQRALRIEVVDVDLNGSPPRPHLLTTDVDRFVILDALTSAWGQNDDGERRRLWADISRTGPEK